MRDCWDRSIIEHSIVSGRHAIFDAVFEIIRQDVYDEEVRSGGIFSLVRRKAAYVAVNHLPHWSFHLSVTYSLKFIGKSLMVLQTMYDCVM